MDAIDREKKNSVIKQRELLRDFLELQVKEKQQRSLLDKMKVYSELDVSFGLEFLNLIIF